MDRRGIVPLAGLLQLAGCSLILDFDDPPPPPDAMRPDAIEMTACEYGEPNESRTVATPLTAIEGQVAGICETGDHDFYSFAVLAGQAVTIEIQFTQNGTLGDLELRLYDGTGALVTSSLSIDADERIVCPGTGPLCGQLAEGNYFFEVFGFESSHVNAYTINLSITGP